LDGGGVRIGLLGHRQLDGERSILRITRDLRGIGDRLLRPSPSLECVELWKMSSNTVAAHAT
jgi:hypothetical protein